MPHNHVWAAQGKNMNFLEDILKEKKDFIERRKKEIPREKLISEIDTSLKKIRFKTILEKPGLHLIAEIKRASPSKGDLRPNLDIVDIANIYQREGVKLVSILTEERFFKGSIEDIKKVKQNTRLSILGKDFIIDEYQIHEAKVYGADAVLLISRILSKEQLRKFLYNCKILDMDVVVEVHNEDDLKKVLDFGTDIKIIGINHRNLEDFSLDLDISARLLPKIPKGKLIIAESGIELASQIKQFRQLGVNAILIGESLMRQENIANKLKEFIGATI